MKVFDWSLFGGLFCGSIWDGGVWFRVFGVGLHAKDTRKHRLYFSERNGYCRLLTVGPWSIKFLPRGAA